MKIYNQYRGLAKEVYVLVFGRVVTNMGALIWPLLTLILSTKMGKSAGDIAILFLLMTALSMPVTFIGGKFADKFNKKHIIILCDLVSVFCFMVCGFIPLSDIVIALLMIGSLFSSIEWPAYDSLIADLTKSEDREKAYSLMYLGANVGVSLAPAVGGLLFKNHLSLAFIINGLAIFSSTVLIYFLIKNITKVKSSLQADSYQIEKHEQSIFEVLKNQKILLLVLFNLALAQFVYTQFNYLLPLNLAHLYGDGGAVMFGFLVSMNGMIVIFGTPIMTQLLLKIRDITKLFCGQVLISCSFVLFLVVGDWRIGYFIIVGIMTIGEIFEFLGRQPYLTKRIPASHRGRMVSMNMVVGGVISAIGLLIIGWLIDFQSIYMAWVVTVSVGVILIGLFYLLRLWDRKVYPLLYEVGD